MPPIDPQTPPPSGLHPAVTLPVVADSNHIPQWAVKGLLAGIALLVVPGSIAVTSYVVGGIHSRLSENEKAIQTLREERAAFGARLTANDANDTAQWRVIGDNKERIGKLKH